MGDKGSKNKGKKETQKKAQRSPKEKRELSDGQSRWTTGKVVNRRAC